MAEAAIPKILYSMMQTDLLIQSLRIFPWKWNREKCESIDCLARFARFLLNIFQPQFSFQNEPEGDNLETYLVLLRKLEAHITGTLVASPAPRGYLQGHADCPVLHFYMTSNFISCNIPTTFRCAFLKKETACECAGTPILHTICCK